MNIRLASLCTVAVLACAGHAAGQPNVVLVVTDDQRWDTLGYMPTVQAELVEKGVHFQNAFVVNPLCCPSRATILTGLYSHAHGVWGNKAAGEDGGMAAFKRIDSFTLPVWLADIGYRTKLVGKYLDEQPEGRYVPPGWLDWLAFRGRNLYFDYELTDGEAIYSFADSETDYSTDVLAAQAEAFIRSAGAEPFFLYVATKAPHITSGKNRFSTEPAPRHVGAYAGLEPWWTPSLNEADMSDKPWQMRRRKLVPPDRLAELRQEQLESLLAVDDLVARLLRALEETGRREDTLIVFTSDNGYAWGEHRWTQKNVPYEESLRVPLVARWDALGAPPRTVKQPVLNVDIAPTIVAGAGVHVDGREGKSLLPLMVGEPWRRHSFLFEHGRDGDSPRAVPAYCGIHDSPWKYVQHDTGAEELYDLARDPYELESLHRERLTTVLRYRQRIRRSACRPPSFQPLDNCTKRGTRGPDRILGSRWPDRVCAGRGRDVVRLRGGGADNLRCGRGRDLAYIDGRDVVRGCELVRR